MIRTTDNDHGMRVCTSVLNREFRGLCFVNFVDFDTVYGHRRDAKGYAEAVMRLDKWLASFIKGMREDDVLMITGDHGCDPAYRGTDHTRENVPLLVYGEAIKPGSLGVRGSFSDTAATIAEMFDVPYGLNGESFLSELI